MLQKAGARSAREQYYSFNYESDGETDNVIGEDRMRQNTKREKSKKNTLK